MASKSRRKTTSNRKDRARPVKRRRGPGRPPKNSGDSVPVNERMLAVATDLFSAVGYPSASIRDIAERSGVTLSSLYHHFGDKRGLYISVYLKAFRQSSARLEAAINTGDTPEERLFSFTTELCRVLSEPGPLFKLVARHWLDGDPDVVTFLARETVPQQYRLVREAIRAIAPDRNPTATALAIYSLVHGLVTLRPFEESLPWKSGIARTAAPMATFALTSLMPEVDWERIAKTARSEPVSARAPQPAKKSL